MNHFELTYYRLYPSAMRVTARDDITGHYEYLAKNGFDANELITHLKERGFQSVTVEMLCSETESKGVIKHVHENAN